MARDISRQETARLTSQTGRRCKIRLETNTFGIKVKGKLSTMRPFSQQNIDLASAWRKAAIRDYWRRIVDTATLQRSML